MEPSAVFFVRECLGQHMHWNFLYLVWTYRQRCCIERVVSLGKGGYMDFWQ